MIAVLATVLLYRRTRRTWQWNEIARYRWRRRGEAGYELYHRLKMLRHEWIWRPTVAGTPIRGELICDLPVSEVTR